MSKIVKTGTLTWWIGRVIKCRNCFTTFEIEEDDPVKQVDLHHPMHVMTMEAIEIVCPYCGEICRDMK